MFFILLTLLTALAIAATSAWFSILGLMAIFSASPISILVMGSVLELGKLVTASWLYRNWKNAGLLLKLYLTSAVVILMLITSMGIFGFLSKSHLDQVRPIGNNVAKIDRIELQIQREQREISDAQTVIAQLDKAVSTLASYDKISGPTGAIAVRSDQSDERKELKSLIDKSQRVIDELEDEKFELDSAVRDVQLEVGPVKYLAELVYDDSEANLDDVVRIVILMIVVVFDPLAVLLLIAANQSLIARGSEKKTSTMESDSGTAEDLPDDMLMATSVIEKEATEIETPETPVTGSYIDDFGRENRFR